MSFLWQVGAIYSMSGRFNYTLTEDTMARVVVKFGITGIDMELGAVRQLHPNSTVSVGVVFGLQGTLLRIKFTRSGTTFDIPIVLSRDYKDWQMAICTYTLPPLIFAAVRHFVWRPLRKKFKRQEVMLCPHTHLALSILGYLLNFSFSSGCLHASWITGVAVSCLARCMFQSCQSGFLTLQLHSVPALANCST